MNQYGLAAVKAVQFFHKKQAKSPREAWERATIELLSEGTSSQTKSCPRDAFLGLCSAGLVKGIPGGKYTKSVKNKTYAIRATELLRTNLALEQADLWQEVTDWRGIKHNGQMDVVLALRDEDLLIEDDLAIAA